VQVDEGVRVLLEHVSFDIPNSEAFVPVRVMVPTTRFTLPVLVTVKVCGAEVLPVFTEPKL
jgi:hypothetical protein